MKTYNIPSISERNFDSLLYNNLVNQKKEGEIIEGRIIGLSRDNVFIDIGLKSEGKVSKNEFNDKNILQVGKKVDVYFHSLENRNGCIQLSRKKVLKERIWKKFSNFNIEHKNINGKIIGRVSKGGFAVNIEGVLAFLPRSQLDTRQINNIFNLINVVQPFKILKIDLEHGNIVVSRRAVLEDLRKEAKSTLLSGIREKMIFQGVVKNITNYGVFIDLGDIDGLLHITDISWKKISHPSEKINLGQSLKVIVTKYDSKNQRISLGLKQLFKNPWDEVKKIYTLGKKYSGIISNFSDHGIFVKLDETIEGFIHANEIFWGNKNPNFKKIFKIGKKVNVIILDINLNKHRINLSIKQCSKNPLEKLFNSFPVGGKINFKPKKIISTGISLIVRSDLNKISFILPFSEISWDKASIISIKEFLLLNIYDSVVLYHDIKNLRIIVSCKRLKMIDHEKNLSLIKFKTNILCKFLGNTNDGFYVIIKRLQFVGFVRSLNLIKTLPISRHFFFSQLKFYDRKKKIFYITTNLDQEDN